MAKANIVTPICISRLIASWTMRVVLAYRIYALSVNGILQQWWWYNRYKQWSLPYRWCVQLARVTCLLRCLRRCGFIFSRWSIFVVWYTAIDVQLYMYVQLHIYTALWRIWLYVAASAHRIPADEDIILLADARFCINCTLRHRLTVVTWLHNCAIGTPTTWAADMNKHRIRAIVSILIESDRNCFFCYQFTIS